MYVSITLAWLNLLIMYSWDSKVYKYKVVESPQTSELTELDSYIFVVRTRISQYLGLDT